MTEHKAKVTWQRSGDFRYETYSRAHELGFEGIAVAGNAAPANIPATVRPQAGVDPEQMLVGALSACHMLWFLHLACRIFLGRISVNCSPRSRIPPSRDGCSPPIS